MSDCKTKIRRTQLKKIYPDVFDELVYSYCSIETENFLETMFDYDKEKRIIMLNIVKKLNKENTYLKETKKISQKNLKTCRLFLKGFQTDINEWKEKSQKLQLKNNILVGNNACEEYVGQIKKNSSNESYFSKESSFNKGLLSLISIFYYY